MPRSFATRMAGGKRVFAVVGVVISYVLFLAVMEERENVSGEWWGGFVGLGEMTLRCRHQNGFGERWWDWTK